jgi:crotonobetainyl-CoA:carnitine CoA-transferase CaiB-like acyl-CoA transferase
VRYANLAKAKSAPPPLVGEQSGKILREFVFDSDQIKALREQGITQPVS